MTALVSYWRSRQQDDDALWPSQKGRFIGWGEPFCFRCGWLPPVADGRRNSWTVARHWLDRAHLVDRWAGGLDTAQNLVPICQLGHGVMPMFLPEEGAQAISWIGDVQDRVVRGWSVAALWQQWTNARGASCRRGPVGMVREREGFLEAVVTLSQDGPLRGRP